MCLCVIIETTQPFVCKNVYPTPTMV